jgi:hypothetical protein
MRSENVFLASARSCCRWPWRQCSLDDLVFQQAQRPSKMRVLAEAGECLRVSTASNPSSTSCWRVRAMVAKLVLSAAAIWLSLNASPPSAASAFNRMRAFISFCAGCLPVDQAIKLLSLCRAELHDIFLYGDLFGGYESAPSERCGAIDSMILLTVNDGRY